MGPVPLYAVVHESSGIMGFKPYFDGREIFIDEEKHFYGPKQRRSRIMFLFRIQTYIDLWKASRANVSGNLRGDGTLLGGALVLGPGDTGILYQHHERQIGDKADLNKVRAAICKITDTL